MISIEEAGRLNRALLLPLMLIVGFSMLWELLHNWQTLPHPYKYVAAYYYYILITPLKWFANVWHYFSNLTSYPNANLIIGGVGVFLYGTLGLGAMAGIFLAVLDLLKIRRHWATIVFSPAIICILWLIGSIILDWLFAK